MRVKQIERKDGWRSWTIVWPEGTVHMEADRFLRLHDGSGTQRTYAYLLVDHLRWLERECLAFAAVQIMTGYHDPALLHSWPGLAVMAGCVAIVLTAAFLTFRKRDA
ncbi:hypothetical protein [Streptomyces antibioticus]|uniref:hypothetical protein n=1 Tax=Streptomyces antibioticus TaxID=1890 RepID=UPI0036DE0E37